MNVLLVTIDQWRADSLSCAGHPCARTPNIDRLAARGVRFARHYAQAAPCGPSRASLLTGMYLHNHRSVGNGTPLDARFTNLALEARALGYVPTLFGYTDTTVDPRTVTDPDDPRLRTYEGVLPGFDVEVQLPEAADAWLAWLAMKGYDVPASVWDLYADRDVDAAEAAGRGPTWAPVTYASEHTEAAFLVDRFVSWHQQRDLDEDWFAHVTFLRPHPPYVAPAPWHDLIDPLDVPLPTRHADPAAEGAEHPMVAGAMFVDEIRAPESERDVRQLRATYWGMLAEVDEKLGWLLDHLDATGDAADTLVVLTADHGEQLADHWLTEKLGYFDESYHIPLVVAGPGVVAGAVVDEFTENIDVMPTILTALDAPVPGQCDGMALQPFLAGGAPERWRDAAHWEWDYRDPRIAELLDLALTSANLAVLRDRHGKYVHFAGLPPAFYDLDADPGELHNVVDDPAYRDRVLDYAQRLLSWRLGTDENTLARLLVTPAGVVEVG